MKKPTFHPSRRAFISGAASIVGASQLKAVPALAATARNTAEIATGLAAFIKHNQFYFLMMPSMPECKDIADALIQRAETTTHINVMGLMLGWKMPPIPVSDLGNKKAVELACRQTGCNYEKHIAHYEDYVRRGLGVHPDQTLFDAHVRMGEKMLDHVEKQIGERDTQNRFSPHARALKDLTRHISGCFDQMGIAHERITPLLARIDVLREASEKAVDEMMARAARSILQAEKILSKSDSFTAACDRLPSLPMAEERLVPQIDRPFEMVKKLAHNATLPISFEETADATVMIELPQRADKTAANHNALENELPALAIG